MDKILLTILLKVNLTLDFRDFGEIIIDFLNTPPIENFFYYKDKLYSLQTTFTLL